MASEAQKAACKRYYEKTKAITKVYMLRLNKKQDADIIAALDGEQNKSDYLRKLIRKDIGR
jgi:hypothetical protein